MARRILPALLAACGAVLGAAARPARADVVELRNGATLEGEVIAETDASVTLRFAGGQVTFEKKLVKEIRKAPLPPPPKPEEAKPEAAKGDGPKPDGLRSDGPEFAPEELPRRPVRGAEAAVPGPAKQEAPKSGPPKPADPAAPAHPEPAAITPAKDDWTLLWSGGKRTGWCHSQAKIDEKGKSIFEQETTVLGADGRPEGTIRYVEEAGPGFAPLGFLLVTDFPGKSTSRSGSVRDGRLVLESWVNGDRAVRDLPLPEGLRFPLAARALVLREAGGGGATWKGASFDPRSGEPAPGRIALLRRERFAFEGADVDTVVLSRSLGEETTEERVAADGRVLAVDFGPKGGSGVGSTAARVEALRNSTTEVEASETEQRGRMSMACPEDGFRIRKPGVSWVLVPAETRESRDRAAVKDISGTVGVVVSSDPAPAGPERPPADLGAALEERLRKDSPDFRPVESGATTFAGCPAWRILADTEHNGDAVRILAVVLARGGRTYTVTATAPRAQFAEARPFLQRILDGFEWL